MQRVTCEVKLASDTQTVNTVIKSGVSPAEIVILLDLHGEGSVINIKPNSMDKVPHGQERERLCGIYGLHVVDRIFPGQFSKLPVTLSDIQIGPAEEAEEGETAQDGDSASDAGNDEVADEDHSANELDEDDKLLLDSIDTAVSKAQLRDIAKENEVDLTGIEDKMDTLKAVIKKQLFPAAG